MAEHHRLSTRSLRSLTTTHPDLAACVREALRRSPVDFAVGEGGRSVGRQRLLVRRGVSRTMNSRHLIDAAGVSHAVDLWPYIEGRVYWPPNGDTAEDPSWEPYHQIARAMAAAWLSLDHLPAGGLDWGVDLWGWDGPHFQLNWNLYPPTKD